MRRIIFYLIIALFVIPLFAQKTESLYVISVDGKKGFINESGKIVINPQFDPAKDFSEDFAIVRVNENWGLIENTGKFTAFPPSVKYVRDFSEGLAVVIEKEKYGFVDTNGKIVIEPQFEKALNFYEGLASVRKNGKWQYIDKTGKTLFETDFIYADNFYNSRAVVLKMFENENKEKRVKAAYIDKKGILVSKWYNFASRFSEDRAFTSNDSRIFAASFKSWRGYEPHFHTGATLEKNINFELINTDGKIISKNLFDDVYGFSDGLAEVVVEGKVGFIDKDGKFAITPKFNSSEKFSEGIAYVGVGNKRYFIDKLGKTLFETEFSLANGFRNGLARVFSCKVLSCKYGYLDTKGNLIAQDR